MTRIISGLARSLQLKVPKTGTRPTSDRVREAMFSTLESWDALEGIRVLDLFAGTGALGIEAASRGASEVDFVEKHPPAAAMLKSNVDLAKAAMAKSTSTVPILKVHRATAATFLEGLQAEEIWDLVFIDPPYDYSDEALTKTLAALTPLLRKNGLLMVERSTRNNAPDWPEGLTELKTKRYGETTLWWAEN